MKKHYFKKVLVVIMAVALITALVPISVLAASASNSTLKLGDITLASDGSANSDYNMSKAVISKTPTFVETDSNGVDIYEATITMSAAPKKVQSGSTQLLRTIGVIMNLGSITKNDASTKLSFANLAGSDDYALDGSGIADQYSGDNFVVWPSLTSPYETRTVNIGLQYTDGTTEKALLRLTIEASAKPVIAVTATGLDNLVAGQSVGAGAAAVYTLTNAKYAGGITAGDFTIGNLPTGLSAGTAVRESDTVVKVPITGTPTDADPSGKTLTIASSIPIANMADVEEDITPQNSIGTITVGGGSVVPSTPPAGGSTAPVTPPASTVVVGSGVTTSASGQKVDVSAEIDGVVPDDLPQGGLAVDIVKPDPSFVSNTTGSKAYEDAILKGMVIAYYDVNLTDASNGALYKLPEGTGVKLTFNLGPQYAGKTVSIGHYDTATGELIEEFIVTCDSEGNATVKASGLSYFIITQPWTAPASGPATGGSTGGSISGGTISGGTVSYGTSSGGTVVYGDADNPKTGDGAQTGLTLALLIAAAAALTISATALRRRVLRAK